ncbi:MULTISPECIES: transporter substrate-binding domain-containing protein [Pseudomonas aeruginosa group]|uniref:transporter substrate-binding domain-containing protein n=1 Tax=Pseudomonas aeruginosa group TaxID=136841 RepID=UPI0006B2A000|nr:MULTISPECIES: transporter substrate-binding domain-containing protein [Pseudomonas aeruginosa group]KPD27347.1 chemotaxis protein CheY [Pseudomonas paraeruginosa]KQB28650.1 two-component system sensor histidine kinase/response regulator [Pseudomonas paraeruginosa]KSP92682.1 hybrid sensor histidine kinase/response regulator [Pseudomonas aeruginosa]KSR37308.1 hybrid sensor histidine kinase/response regulator [Pseudomonas aeruginosa]MCW8019527.1 transporter substrate-binding domain-containing 
MRSKLLLLFICLLLPAVPLAATQAGASMTLFSQMHVEHEDMVIGEDDWAWVRHKGTLRVGVALDETAPFNVRLDDENYEGITADVTALVGQLLGMRIKLVAYATHAAAIEALGAGQIDLLGSHYSALEQPALVSSRPYARDRLAVFKRVGEPRNSSADLAGLRVAVAREHDEELRQRFPRARFVVFDNHDEAIAAVAFGHTDLYIDDVLSAYQRINRSFYGYVKFERFADTRSDGGYGYLLRSDETRLLRVVNAAIGAIDQDRLEYIARRWVGGGSLPTGERIALTPEERRWVARHPVVRLVINDDLAPLAFFNSNDVFSGITSDLLEMISRRTGLHFQVSSRSGGFPEQIAALQKGQADLAIMSRSSRREETLRFTRSFLSTSFVLIARADEKGRAERVGNLDGKRLAIPSGHVGIQGVRDRYPQAAVVEVETTLDAMNLVYEGRAEAAVVPLVSARYYIVRLFHERLAVADQVALGPATANFAVRRGDTELQTILDKALLSISPGDLSDVVNRWRSPPGMSGQTWVDYTRLIAEIVAAAAGLLLLSLGWVTYQRRQIRDRLRVEQALNDQLQFVEALTDSMPPPLYVRDANGRMLSCNRSYLSSVGLAAEQVLNRTVLELPMENFETGPQFHRNYLEAMRDGRTIESVHEVVLGGRKCWIDHWIQPFRDANGTVRGVICGWLDISEHRKLVAELKEAKNLADEASRAKTTFLATMSHEIRTPMNAVIGILELALKRADTGRVDRSSIEIAYASAKSLLELIGDILDIARIESGRLGLSPKRANLRELVESVARVFEGLARQKRLSLILDIDASINGDVLLDAMRFKQILSNLVSNAIKFTDEGSISIRIDGHLVEPSLLQVNLCVEDTGIGISLGDQQQLFRPFAQVERNVQNTEGTGLGLVICRSLCEMMGGRLVMSSALGQGTRVDVELRLQVLEPVSVSERPVQVGNRQARRLQVLVVDDHAVNRQILHQQLSFLGHDVQEAENGLAALNLWHEQPFDMVITDCHMPLMNGSDLARSIRQEERENNEEPVVILGLTADAQPEEIERCIQAGMNECLIKPIGLDVLEERLLALGFAEEQEETSPVSLDAEPVAAPPLPLLYDLESLHALTGGEPSMLRRLLDELLTSNRKDLEALEILVQRQETGELAELAHRIKGAARVVRGEQLVDSCRRLEEACLNPNAAFSRVEECAVGVKLALLALDEGLLGELAE